MEVMVLEVILDVVVLEVMVLDVVLLEVVVLGVAVIVPGSIQTNVEVFCTDPGVLWPALEDRHGKLYTAAPV